MRAFLIVIPNLEAGREHKIGSLLALDNSFKLHIPTLRKMGIFKCTGEKEEFLPATCDYGKIAVKNLSAFEQRGQMIGDNSVIKYNTFASEIPETICSLVESVFRCKPIYCKRGDFQSATKECGDAAKTYSCPIIYTKDNESVLKIAVHENCYKEKEFFELVEMTKEVLKQFNIHTVEGKMFAGKSGDYYKTQHKKIYKNLPLNNNLLTKLAEKHISCIGVGRVQDYVSEKYFSENYFTKTDPLALKTLERLARPYIMLSGKPC